MFEVKWLESVIKNEMNNSHMQSALGENEVQRGFLSQQTNEDRVGGRGQRGRVLRRDRIKIKFGSVLSRLEWALHETQKLVAAFGKAFIPKTLQKVVYVFTDLIVSDLICI